MHFIQIKSNELLIDGRIYGGKAIKATARAVSDAIRAGVADAIAFAGHVLGNAKLPGERRDRLLSGIAWTAARIWRGDERPDYYRHHANQRQGRRDALAERVAAMPIGDLIRTASELKASKPLTGYAARAQALLDHVVPEAAKHRAVDEAHAVGLVDAEIKRRLAVAPSAPAHVARPASAPARASTPSPKPVPSRGGWACGEGDYDRCKQAARERLGAKAPAAAVAKLAGELLAKSL